jgi:hypothetical protein
VVRQRFDPTPLNTLVADSDEAPRALLEHSTKVVLRCAPLRPAAVATIISVRS